MKGQRIGYVRVSSFDQNPERQIEQVQVDKVFTDKASGKDTQRPQLGDGGHRAVEHGLSGAGGERAARQRPCRRSRPVAVSVSAGLGAHQPDRRLPLAQQRQNRRG